MKYISQKYTPVIYVIGKSSAEDPAVLRGLKELREKNGHVYYESLDARDKGALERVFRKAVKQHGKIDLVINGAGAVSIGFLKDKKEVDISHEFTNKVLPARNVLDLAVKYRPKRIVNFSSIISKYGSAGQTIYTSANALVSGLTEEYNDRLKQSGSTAVTVHWPPWDSVGMTGNKGVSQKMKEYHVSLLDPQDANALFAHDLAASSSEPVYYLDDADDMFYGFPLSDLQEYRSLIGELKDPFSIAMSHSTFQKTFDLERDAYLRDHTIEGSSYVPAAVGIGMFLCAGSMYYKKFPVLKDIKISNPIIVKDPGAECVLEIEINGKRSSFSIRSHALHFHCAAEEGEADIKVPVRAVPKAVREIAVRSIYSDYYFKDSLYLGPIFQTIHRALIDAAGEPFIVVKTGALLPVLGLGNLDTLMQLIDASFQALGAVALLQNKKMIPIKIAELFLFPGGTIPSSVFVIPSDVRFSGDELEGDVDVCNEKGGVLLSLRGVTLRKIGTYAENKLDIGQISQ